eukprot:1462456-Amphidinium_carterae.1
MPRKYMRGTGKLAMHALRRVARRLRHHQNALSDLSDGEDEPHLTRNGDVQRSRSNSPDNASESSERHCDTLIRSLMVRCCTLSIGTLVQQCEVLGRCRPNLEDMCRRCVKAQPDIF